MKRLYRRLWARVVDALFPERCIACRKPLRDGDLYFWDVNGGELHAACCGPERECYVDAEGEPLGPDGPIPTPSIWRYWRSLTAKDPA